MMHKWMLLLLLLAACSAPPAPDATPAPGTTSVAEDAPPYREPSTRITAENAPQLAYLGRLDPPGSTASTIFAHSFAPDGTRLAGLNNDLIMAWDLITGERIFSTSRAQAVRVYYAPDKSELYSLLASGEVRVLDSVGGREQTSFFGTEGFNSVQAYSGDTGLLALGSDAGTVRLWDTAERTALATVSAVDAPIDRLAFNPDASILAAAGRDGVLRLWNWRLREQLAALDHGGNAVVNIAFSEDGSLVASAAPEFLAVWSLPDGEQLYTRPLEVNGASEILAFSPGGRYLIAGGANAPLTVWEPETGEELARLPEVSGNRMSASFSPDGSLMLTTVLDRAVRLWNLSEATEETVPGASLDLPTRRIVRADWTTDGFTIAFFDAAGPVYLWGIPAEGS